METRLETWAPQEKCRFLSPIIEGKKEYQCSKIVNVCLTCLTVETYKQFSVLSLGVLSTKIQELCQAIFKNGKYVT